MYGLLVLTLFGCAPGHLAWNGGDDVLHTAWLDRTTEVPGWEHARVFLSNGDFPCELPSFSDPASQQEALVALVAASCREDARHLRIDAWWPDASDGLGYFPGDARAVAGDARVVTPFAQASYVGIDEGASDGSSSLTPAYEVLRRTYEPDLGAPGSLEVTRSTAGALRAKFAFQEAHISGDFEATLCVTSGGTSLFDVLDGWGQDPTLLCSF